jgi:hypothetical protein
MAEQLSEGRLQLIRSYMEEQNGGEPVEAAGGHDESDEAAAGRTENETAELRASIGFAGPAMWYVPQPVWPGLLRWRIGRLLHSHIASALALVSFALALGWIVAHLG